MTVEELKKLLKLEPHPREGGWFCETYQSRATLPASAFAAFSEPVQYDGPRRLSTAIYYLLEPDTFSEMHRLQSDEVFHFYCGSAVEMLQLWPDGRTQRVVIGDDFLAGQRPQLVIPRGVWQGSRLLPTGAQPGSWALMGCTVSPGFEYADYETGTRSELAERYPQERALITALTRDEHR